MLFMNNIKGTSEHPIWYGSYDNATKSLISVKKQVAGVTIDNSQSSYVMENGVPNHLYSAIACSTKELFLSTMATYGITNPDNLEIED